MKAKTIMTKYPVVVAADDTIRHAAQLMAQIDVGALPVVDHCRSGRLVGMITDRDIVVRHVARGGRDCCVKDHMTTHNIEFVHPDTDVRDVLGRMGHEQVRRIPVVDDDRVVVGIISRTDIEKISEPGRVLSTI